MFAASNSLRMQKRVPYAAIAADSALAATWAGGQVSCNSPPLSTARRTPIMFEGHSKGRYGELRILRPHLRPHESRPLW